MRIPLVGTPEPDLPSRTFTPGDATTFDKVGQAGARVGQAVEGIAQDANDRYATTKAAGVGFGASDLTIRVKQAVDQGTISKLETQGEVHFQAFVDSLNDGQNPENNDPHSYATRWKDQATTFTESTAEDPAVKALGPVARQQYAAQMAKWSAMTSQQVGHLATQKALQNAIGDTRVDYEQKLRLGDTAGAEATVNKAMATGIFNAEEGKQMIYQIPMKNEYNQAVSMMSRDPQMGGGPVVLEEALRKVNEDGSFQFYKHITGQTREALLSAANRNANILRGDTSRKYADQQASGEQPDPNDVQRDLRLGLLSGPAAKALLKPQKVFTPANFAKAVTVISSYDPKTDPSHEREAQIWASLNEASPHLSPEANARLNSLLKDKLKDESKLNSEVAKHGNSIISENFRLGVFGKFENKVMDKEGNWSTQTNTKVLDSAQINRAKVQTALNDWLAKPVNADATPEDVARFLSATTRAMRIGSLWAPIINPATGKKHP